jgi:DNA-binding LytR/AlgR family response regulator
MNILIIEDEALVALSLMELVRTLEPSATLEGPLVSVQQSVQWLKTHAAPDLILCDIQLADGISLDIFNNLPIDCPIIFTTAFNEYAIRAFKLNSIDYLLKPVEKQDLAAAFQKFHLLQSKYGNKQYLSELKAVFHNFEQPKKYKERFAVYSGRSVILVPAAEAACFIKEEIIYLLHRNGIRYITDFRSLDEVEELIDPTQFFRVNRQYLVHLDAMESYQSDEWGKLRVRLKPPLKESLTVSKDKAAEFRRWFG